MSFSQNLIKNIFSGEVDIIKSGDILPTGDDIANIGASNRRFNNLFIDKIYSTGSPIASFFYNGTATIATTWTDVAFNDGFARNATYNAGTNSLTYTGVNAFVNISVRVNLQRIATTTNAGVRISINNLTVDAGFCNVGATAGAIVPITLSWVGLLNNGDVIKIQCVGESGTVSLTSYAVLGFSSKACSFMITEALTN